MSWSVYVHAKALATGLIFYFITLPVAAPSVGIQYRLKYSGAGSSRVTVEIRFADPVPSPVSFVIPRNYPGGYNLVLYDSFVETPQAFSVDEEPLSIRKDPNGPRWNIAVRDKKLMRIEYEVDIRRMEQGLHDAIDSSKVRAGYLGILGYSVFGYIDGLEQQTVDLQIEAPKDWSVFTTLAPSVPAATGSTSAEADNYYTLADSEILMGRDLQLLLVKGNPTLIMAAYIEANEDLAIEAQLARNALDAVEAYFGNSPLNEYTVQLELLHPLPGHDYGFSQEHLNSGTFTLAASRAITSQSTAEQRQAAEFNYAHHMAHCWIPKRAYGIGYLPFSWETPPVIDTIWFNEGFARYAAIAALAETMPSPKNAEFRREQLSRVRTIVEDAPQFIREMPLLTLSREASFMYSLDFRIGMNTFARGTLMAAEIDDRIRSRTSGQKSLRDSLRFLLGWSTENGRAFQTEELGRLLSQSVDVDISDILARWMKPNPKYPGRFLNGSAFR